MIKIADSTYVFYQQRSPFSHCKSLLIGDFQTGMPFYHPKDFKCPLLTLDDRKMTLNLPFSWVINLFSSSVGVVLIFKTISSLLWFFNAVSISALELFRLSKVRRRRFACLNIKILNQKGQDAKLKTWWRSTENLSSKILISRGFEFLVSKFLIFR